MHAITKYIGFVKQVSGNHCGPRPINYSTVRNFCKSKPRPYSTKIINGNSWNSNTVCQNVCQPYVYGRSCNLSYMAIRRLQDNAVQRAVALRLGCQLNRPLYQSRTFSKSSVRLAPPLLILVGKAAAKLLAVVSGRGFRKWWRSLPNDKRLYFLDVVKSNRFKIVGALTILSVLLFIYYESHIQEAPFTNRKRFIAFTEKQFDEIADFEFKMQYEIYQPSLLPSNHPHYARVSQVIQRILKPHQHMKVIKDKTWSIAVVDTEEENAFVLPKGQIFVFSGILKMCSNDDQLAVILAHEISHCILGHAAENLSFSHLVDFGIVAVIAGIWAVVPSDIIALIAHWFFNKVVQLSLDLPFNRKLEKEADEVGLQLLANACYDVRESSVFWSKMSLKNGDEVEWLSTHPSNESRSVYLDSLMDEALSSRQGFGCSELSKQDPRNVIKEFKKKLKSVEAMRVMVPVEVK